MITLFHILGIVCGREISEKRIYITISLKNLYLLTRYIAPKSKGTGELDVAVLLFSMCRGF